MMNALPKQLTNEQAARMLVKLPVGAPQITNVRRAGYRISGGEGDHEEVKEEVHEQAPAIFAPPNLDYRFLSVGGATVPYVSYYPYVYNFSNSHWAPYAAYVSGRYYYPYYQGYGSLYAPYSYSQIMPYGGVYAMRTGTILR